MYKWHFILYIHLFNIYINSHIINQYPIEGFTVWSYNCLTSNRCEPNMLIFCYTWVCARPRLLFSASKIGRLAVIPATKNRVHYLDLSWWLLDIRSFGKQSYTLFGSWKIHLYFFAGGYYHWQQILFMLWAPVVRAEDPMMDVILSPHTVVP